MRTRTNTALYAAEPFSHQHIVSTTISITELIYISISVPNYIWNVSHKSHKASRKNTESRVAQRRRKCSVLIIFIFGICGCAVSVYIYCSYGIANFLWQRSCMLSTDWASFYSVVVVCCCWPDAFDNLPYHLRLRKLTGSWKCCAEKGFWTKRVCFLYTIFTHLIYFYVVSVNLLTT